jgi:hypothetical protein
MMYKRKKSPTLASLQSESFYIVKIDAPPGVEVPGGCYVTVQSGPHFGVKAAFERLRDPKPRAHTLPDIVFLPTNSSVYVLDEAVQTKPYLLVNCDDLERARLRQNPESSSMTRARQVRGVPEAPDSLTTPPDKLHKQARLAFTDEKEKDLEGVEKRQKVGKLSPKVLHFDEHVKPDPKKAAIGNLDTMSALRAAYTANLMWMLSNPEMQQSLPGTRPVTTSTITTTPTLMPKNIPSNIDGKEDEIQQEEEVAPVHAAEEPEMKDEIHIDTEEQNQPDDSPEEQVQEDIVKEKQADEVDLDEILEITEPEKDTHQ